MGGCHARFCIIRSLKATAILFWSTTHRIRAFAREKVEGDKLTGFSSALDSQSEDTQVVV